MTYRPHSRCANILSYPELLGFKMVAITQGPTPLGLLLLPPNIQKFQTKLIDSSSVFGHQGTMVKPISVSWRSHLSTLVTGWFAKYLDQTPKAISSLLQVTPSKPLSKDNAVLTNPPYWYSIEYLIPIAQSLCPLFSLQGLKNLTPPDNI